MNRYDKAEELYKNAYITAKELKLNNLGFFLLYLAVISIFLKHIVEAEKILFEYKHIHKLNTDNGLFLILNGIVSIPLNKEKGNKLYKKGIKTARKENWQEDINLADKLLKSL